MTKKKTVAPKKPSLKERENEILKDIENEMRGLVRPAKPRARTKDWLMGLTAAVAIIAALGLVYVWAPGAP